MCVGKTGRVIVSLDLDGTLIDSPFPAALRVAADLVAPDRPDEFRAAVSARHRELVAAGGVAGYDWTAIVGEIAVDYGVATAPDMAALVADVAPMATRLLEPTALRLLGEHRARDTRLVIVTNGFRCFQEQAIRAVGLDSVVDEVITADDVHAAKPDRAIFAAAYYGHAGPRIHVGDRHDHDVIGGHDSGARTILIADKAPTELHPQPDAVVSTVVEALEMVDAITWS